MKKSSLILSIISLSLIFIVFIMTTFAWFTLQEINQGSNLETRIVDRTTGNVDISDDSGAANQYSLSLLPNEYEFITLQLNVRTNVNLSSFLSNISYNKNLTTFQNSQLYAQANYKNALIQNITTNRLFTGEVTEQIYRDFVDQANITQAIKCGAIISSESMTENEIVDEISTQTIDSPSVLDEKSLLTLNEFIYNNSVFQTTSLQTDTYYLYFIFYFDPNVYPTKTYQSISDEEYTLQLMNSNAYMFQTINFNIIIENT